MPDEKETKQVLMNVSTDEVGGGGGLPFQSAADKAWFLYFFLSHETCECIL